MTGHRDTSRGEFEIRHDDLQGTAIQQLLIEHLEYCNAHSPPESVHALDLDELRQENVTVWSVWRDNELAGCGALKELDAGHGEVKSMRTSTAFLKQGVATTVLQHIITEAKRRGYKRLSLETGSMDAFQQARALYLKMGFEPCPPFADYTADPHSVHFTRSLIGES